MTYEQALSDIYGASALTIALGIAGGAIRYLVTKDIENSTVTYFSSFLLSVACVAWLVFSFAKDSLELVLFGSEPTGFASLLSAVIIVLGGLPLAILSARLEQANRKPKS